MSLGGEQSGQAISISTIFSRRTAKYFGFIGAAFVVSFAFVIAVSVFRIPIPYFDDISKSSILLLIGLAFLVLAGLVFSAVYLEVFGEDYERKAEHRDLQMESLVESVTALERQMKEQISSGLSRKEISDAAERVYSSKIKKTIEERISTDVKEIVREEMLSQYGDKVYREASVAVLKDFYGDFVSGIHIQLNKQQRNANFNVMLGMVFAALGLAVMGYVLYDSYMRVGAGGIKGWDQFVFEYIPKLTFVLLFESIAFFFLQAYKEDRSMVRYLRNEATNVESRILGLLSGIYFGGTDDVGQAVKTLMSTERNFTIKKGEKIILELFQNDQPMMFEKVVERLVPDLAKRLDKLGQDAKRAGADPK